MSLNGSNSFGLDWDIDTVTDMLNIDNETGGETPVPVTISNGDVMDPNTATTSCSFKVDQFCLFEQGNCFLNNNGTKGVSASALPLFVDQYPECSGATETVITTQNPSNMTQGYLNPKDPNFLGGANMRQAIMVILAIAILLVVSGGKPIRATAQAVKKAV